MNSTVGWLGHLADEILVEINQQFSRPRGRHDALIAPEKWLEEVTAYSWRQLISRNGRGRREQQITVPFLPPGRAASRRHSRSILGEESGGKPERSGFKIVVACTMRQS